MASYIWGQASHISSSQSYCLGGGLVLPVTCSMLPSFTQPEWHSVKRGLSQSSERHFEGIGQKEGKKDELKQESLSSSLFHRRWHNWPWHVPHLQQEHMATGPPRRRVPGHETHLSFYRLSDLGQKTSPLWIHTSSSVKQTYLGRSSPIKLSFSQISFILTGSHERSSRYFMPALGRFGTLGQEPTQHLCPTTLHTCTCACVYPHMHTPRLSQLKSRQEKAESPNSYAKKGLHTCVACAQSPKFLGWNNI